MRVANPGKSLAFIVALKIVDKADGHELLPVFWDDNYFELMPGESRTIAVHYMPGQLRKVRGMRVEVGGWNVESQSILLPLHASR